MSSTQMEITKAGILNINRKILDSRKYDKNLITTVGDYVVIINGTASRFDENNYLYQTIALEDKNMSITCSGTIITSGDDQVAFSLAGNNGELLELHFNNSQASIVLNSEILLQFSGLKIYSGLPFNIILDLMDSSPLQVHNKVLRATLILEDVVFEEKVTLKESFDPSRLTELYIGSDGNELPNFWYGSINLNTFTISQKGKLVYSPSTTYSLAFSKILVSSGEFPLTDDSVPILNHIVECPLEEISRSGSTLLLKSEVDKNADIVIKEIGLYANVEGKEILFGLLQGLNVNKSFDSSYELIIAINLYLSFVHVTGFPNENSFKLVEPKYALLKDFQIVRDLNLYLYSNYERIVRNNSMELGYNTAEVFYELQKNIGYYESCYSSSQSCLKIMQRLNKYKEIDEDTGEEIIEKRKALKQFYVLPKYRKIRYSTKDLCNLEDYCLTFTYKSFKGNKDEIKFSDEFNSSLCLKVNLENAEPKLILTKTNLINDPYFTILFTGDFLHVFITNEEKIIVLSKEISDKELPLFTRGPILLSLVKNGTNFSLYRNEERIAEFNGIFGTPYDFTNYFLCNHLQEQALEKLRQELSIPSEIMNKISENYDKYVENIIFIKGAINSEDLKYINLLMGTRD